MPGSTGWRAQRSHLWRCASGLVDPGTTAGVTVAGSARPTIALARLLTAM
ncbi:hypothetical protein SPHINGOAX6_20187 [Sphingomonas sp. AX6]|nr:hypothetical protein SPHINGOAX6_20187 [Sphingomonas sp. AX6]